MEWVGVGGGTAPHGLREGGGEGGGGGGSSVFHVMHRVYLPASHQCRAEQPRLADDSVKVNTRARVSSNSTLICVIQDCTVGPTEITRILNMGRE